MHAMMQQSQPQKRNDDSRGELIARIETELVNAIEGKHARISKSDAQAIQRSFRQHLKKGLAPLEALVMAKSEIISGDDGLSRYYQRGYRGQRGGASGGNGHGKT